MTLMGLQTGFGEARGASTMAALKAAGCVVCRVELNVGEDRVPVTPDAAMEIVGEVTDAGMVPYVIIRDPAQIELIPPGVDVELGNEPDLAHFGWTLDSYLSVLWPTIRRCDGRNPLNVGAVSNLLLTHPWEDPRGLTFLAGLPWIDIPSWVRCSHHWYPGDDPHASHIPTGEPGDRDRPPQSREADIVMLRDIVGERPLAMSETGYWTPMYGTRWHVADHIAQERAFWVAQGYDIAIGYQIDDAPHDKGHPHEPEHGYGFRILDSIDDWKPVAGAWFGA